MSYSHGHSVSKNPRVIRAYNAWRNQRKRCSGKGIKDKTYHGLSVDYSANELVNWFLKNTTESDYNYVIGRKNHDIGYSLSNIQLETIYESMRESLERCRQKGITMANKFSNENLLRFKSIEEASMLTGISSGVIINHATRNKKNPYSKVRNRGIDVTFFYS